MSSTAELLEDLPERLRSRIELDEAGECWLWLASTRNGYGRVRWPVEGRKRADGGNPMVSAHRLVWQLLVDPTLPLLPGKRSGVAVLDHICRTRRCVNPSHLRVITHRANVVAGKLHSDGSSKFPGVSRVPGQRARWRPQILVDGRQRHLGYYLDERVAFDAYLAALAPIDAELHAELIAIHGSPEPTQLRLWDAS